MKEEIREDLHKLLDKMLDEGKEVGTISRMIENGNWCYKVQNVRLTLKTQEYELK